MKGPQESIAQRLRRAMETNGKRQADLVREAGLDRGAVSSYLSGKYEPKQKAIYAMARVLNVSEAWLLGYDVPMERSLESKRNDQLAKLVAKMRSDEGFFDTVSNLAELTEEQYQSIKLLISTFKKQL